MSIKLRKWVLLLAITGGLASTCAADMASLPDAVSFLDYHLRLKPDRFAASQVTMTWNVSDTACVAAVYTIPAQVSDDALSGVSADYRVVRRGVADGDSIIYAGTFSVSYPAGKRAGVSAWLRYRNGMAWLSFGGDVVSETVSVPFEAVAPGLIGYSASRPLQELCNEVMLVGTEKPPVSPVNTLAELNEHIASSDDKLECYWKYFDRDTDPALANPGGFYTLATVSDNAGGYKILYIDGDASGATPKLTVKGVMTPTIFPNHYDLVWYDVNGAPAARECSASVELSGSMLRISIPLLKATMRFSRLEGVADCQVEGQ